MKLDKKDKQILYQLDINAKQSARQIAKHVKLSKDTVNYRINRLFENNIIKKKIASLNTPALGYMHYKFLIKLHNVDQQKEEEILNFFIDHHRVIWCVKAYGSWDISASYLVKNLKELNNLIKELILKYGSFIKEKAISQIMEAPTFTRDYITGHKKAKLFAYKEVDEHIKIDELDHKLLILIAQDASGSYLDLAKKLKTTVDIVRYKIKQLEKKGVIQGFRVAMNHKKIGIKYYKIMLNLTNLTDQQEKKFIQFCTFEPHVVQLIKYIGPWEIELELEALSEEKIYETLFKIRKEFSNIISSYEILKLEDRKMNYYPFKL